ncbi:protein phosphatase PHLPP-like protein [Planococcus citri]|uniref:protein phosphatase PHLPP-like protein n=1 Tax=Planococcus citri TaxID=170843 RepID=UPI0031F9F463
MKKLSMRFCEHLMQQEWETRNNNLSVINLKNSSLKGNIQLANYGNLTELNVSNNSIEHLDLSAIPTLERVDCSRNKISELTLNGTSLTSVTAAHNKLKSLTVSPAPNHLQHLNVSYNEIEKLPDWVSESNSLKGVNCSHNRLRELPQDIFLNEDSVLSTLQLSFNQLTTLPQVMRRVPLQQLYLQNNSLITLPRHFFIASSNLKILNVSKNCLKEIPQFICKNESLEQLYLTSNALTDITPLLNCIRLKVLHVAYNAISSLPEGCISAWPDMQELIISGNNVYHLPENICSWYYLKIFRAHSNLLTTSPSFVNNNSLKVLDLSHNYLEKLDIMSLIPKQLMFLDISGNNRLQIDSKQFQHYKIHRSVNLVDVSGFNRNSLPCMPIREEIKAMEQQLPWSIGFSETTGKSDTLHISQLRLPTFCNSEALIGVFDTTNDTELSKLLVKTAPPTLLAERTEREANSDYLKYTMVSLLREVKDSPRQSDVHITLCHICKTEDPQENTVSRYLLRIASVGDTKTILCRNFGSLTLSNNANQNHQNHRQSNGHNNQPNILQDLHTTEISLHEQDQFLLLASKSLWEVISTEEAVAEVRSVSNPVLAAKRLQDLAQSYNCEKGLSVVVLRFQNLAEDFDLLAQEMRQTIRSTKSSNKICTCDQSRIENLTDSERSSPSGQSDKFGAIRINQSIYGDSISIKNYPTRKYSHPLPLQDLINNRDQNEISFKDIYNGNMADGEESFSDRSGLQMAEERFRCWEYMLEQNTQMLFDKELDTLSKSFTKRSIPSKPDLWAHTKSVSHLPDCIQPLPFVSKRFGSARSYNTSRRLDMGRKSLSGGPNAAYFGSLQHLMPYHLEYDFSEIKEKYDSNLDSLEMDGRMHKYWDVATTEL